MSKKHVSGRPAQSLSRVDRLNLLLPWLNGDPDALPSERVARFLTAGFFDVWAGTARDLTGIRAGRWDEAVLRAKLLTMLDGKTHNLAFPSLRVDLVRDGTRYVETIRAKPHDAVL